MATYVHGLGIGGQEVNEKRTGIIDAQVAIALGALVGVEGYRTVVVTGQGPGMVRHYEFLGVVDEIVSRLGSMEPPRQLASAVQYLRGGDGMQAYISTETKPPAIAPPSGPVHA